MSLVQAERAAQPAGSATPSEGRLFSGLRDVREEVVRLRGLIADARTVGGTGSLLTPVIAAVMDRETVGIDRRLDEAGEVLAHDDLLADHWSDAVARVANLWDDVKSAWAAITKAEMTADLFLGMLDAMIVEIGVVTIPPRAADNLRGLRVGGVMDFHREFADEIPTASARTRILSWMNDHPLSVPGVVDIAAGTIVKASPKWWRRGLSWLGIALVMAVAFAAAATSTRWLGDLQVGKVPADAADHRYVLAVAFAYAGAVFHLLVGMLKQVRSAGAAKSQSFTALGNFTVWVHVREVYLMLYALAIPVAAYALILTTGSIVLVTLFFLGYSIDSLLELLLARFDSSVSKQGALLTQALTANRNDE